ncbi:MAG: cellulase family glycosylhydrolase [Armatimonadota bacterium]
MRFTLAAILLATLALPMQAATLGITKDGANFSIDGRPAFLNGISYYAATSISTPEFLTRDLDDMARYGINWIRVWTMWNINDQNYAVVNPDGTVREPFMSRLKTIIRECNRRKIMVDVTMHRGPHPVPSNQAEHLVCARTLALELKGFRNVYFDVANERDVGDARFVSYKDMGELITAVKASDPKRICTASGVPNSSKNLNEYLTTGHCDFIATHLGRGRGDSSRTLGEVAKFVGWMKQLGRRVPVHLQEPFRQGYGNYTPEMDDYYRDAEGGKLAGAAGWCLHNGSSQSDTHGRPNRSFQMSDTDGRLFTQLDKLELVVAADMKEQIGGLNPGTLRYQAEYSEQVSHTTGRRDGTAWMASPGEDKAGELCSGLAVKPVSSGRYRISCRLQALAESSGDTEAATISVVSDGKLLASKKIKGSELAKPGLWREFAVTCTVKESPLDVRISWPGTVSLKLDWVQISRP